MLAHLSVNNFAIVKSLQLELSKGMTTITGETGAGKSIAIDALGLCLVVEPTQAWCDRVKRKPKSALHFYWITTYMRLVG